MQIVRLLHRHKVTDRTAMYLTNQWDTTLAEAVLEGPFLLY